MRLLIPLVPVVVLAGISLVQNAPKESGALLPQPSPSGGGAASKPWPQVPDGFKGVKFGDELSVAATVVDFDEWSPAPCRRKDRPLTNTEKRNQKREDDRRRRSGISEPEPIEMTCGLTINAGHLVLLHTDFRFYRSKFYLALGRFRSERYQEVRKLFIDKYGLPHSAQTSTVQNAFGAKYEQEKLLWTDGLRFVHLERFWTDLKEGYFAVGDGALVPPIDPKDDGLRKKALQ